MAIEGYVRGRWPKKLIPSLGLLLGVFVLIGAGPGQADRPPQPFFQDFLTGIVSIQGIPAPAGTILIACINDCDTGFESAPYRLKPGGRFDQLEVNPDEEGLVGHLISFFLMNEYGRIRALETRPYIGVFDFYIQNLTFVDPVPTPGPTPLPKIVDPTPKPTPTAALPVAGDPALARLPRWIVVLGIVVTIFGGTLMLLTRRWARQAGE